MTLEERLRAAGVPLPAESRPMTLGEAHLFGLSVLESPAVPPGEVRFVDPRTGEVKARIVNIREKEGSHGNWTGEGDIRERERGGGDTGGA